jgi:hypothetical protein
MSDMTGTKPQHVRALLQCNGDYLRGKNPNVFVDMLHKKLKSLETTVDVAIVTDLRFQNEYNFIQSVGGSVIRITSVYRNHSRLLAESYTGQHHASETELDWMDRPGCDTKNIYIYQNDPHSTENIYDILVKIRETRYLM